MAYLVLNEAFRVVELDQVGHVGVAERVQVQFSGQARFLAGVVERSVDRPQRETSSSVACQRDGTGSLPRAWDHLEVSVSMLGLPGFVKGDVLMLPV